MAVPSDEHEGTMPFAELAIGQIKALRQPATPRNFEFWYEYVTGYNAELNKAVNETLRREGTVPAETLNEIRASYLAPSLAEPIESVGAMVADEIERIMARIDGALGRTSSYTESLADVSKKLGSAATRDALRLLVERLLRATHEAEKTTGVLNASLSASRHEINQLQAHLETIRAEALCDPLTGLANRKHFDQMFARAVEEANCNGTDLSLLMADIDAFKTFNDAHGHMTGDQVLRVVAEMMRQNIKGQDIAARYGGEEFAILLPNTPLPKATAVADNIRRAVASKELIKRSNGENLGRVSMSIGVAQLREGEASQGLIERADGCLYAAKRNGRNKIVSETELDLDLATKKRAASGLR